MSLILCIDTSTDVCSVALAKDGVPVCVKEERGGYSHAALLTVFIEQIFQLPEWDMKKLDAVAISKGPGSFTGLRVGTSVAKGLCYGLDLPLIAVDTLKGLAFQCHKQLDKQLVEIPDKTMFIPMIDARRMEVYTAFYGTDFSQIKEVHAKIIAENSFEELLSDYDKLYIFGNGSEKCRDILEHEKIIPVSACYTSASNIAYFAHQKFREKNYENLAYYEPFYLKPYLPKLSNKGRISQI